MYFNTIKMLLLFKNILFKNILFKNILFKNILFKNTCKIWSDPIVRTVTCTLPACFVNYNYSP